MQRSVAWPPVVGADFVACVDVRVAGCSAAPSLGSRIRRDLIARASMDRRAPFRARREEILPLDNPASSAYGDRPIQLPGAWRSSVPITGCFRLMVLRAPPGGRHSPPL